MGSYINRDSKGVLLGSQYEYKLKALLEDGAKKIPIPTEWREGLVCVIDNGWFGAAAYAYSEDEMKAFIEGSGGREFQWLEFDKAKQLAD